MRIEGLDRRQAPWSARPLYAATQKMLGRVVKPLTVFARRPGILWGYALFTTALERAKKVEAPVKTLVSLRAAQLVGCPF